MMCATAETGSRRESKSSGMPKQHEKNWFSRQSPSLFGVVVRQDMLRLPEC